MTKARRYLCMPASGLTYEVRAPIQPGEHPHEYAVDLDKKTCTCHVFQAQGFPCIHATKVVLYRRDPIKNYVDEAFKVAAYLKTYEGGIFPRAAAEDVEAVPTFAMPEDSDDDIGLSSDEDDALKPPNTCRLPGRPRKKRARHSIEKEPRPFKCGRCGELRHNRRGCSASLLRGNNA